MRYFFCLVISSLSFFILSISTEQVFAAQPGSQCASMNGTCKTLCLSNELGQLVDCPADASGNTMQCCTVYQRPVPPPNTNGCIQKYGSQANCLDNSVIRFCATADTTSPNLCPAGQTCCAPSKTNGACQQAGGLCFASSTGTCPSNGDVRDASGDVDCTNQHGPGYICCHARASNGNQCGNCPVNGACHLQGQYCVNDILNNGTYSGTQQTLQCQGGIWQFLYNAKGPACSTIGNNPGTSQTGPPWKCGTDGGVSPNNDFYPANDPTQKHYCALDEFCTNVLSTAIYPCQRYAACTCDSGGAPSGSFTCQSTTTSYHGVCSDKQCSTNGIQYGFPCNSNKTGSSPGQAPGGQLYMPSFVDEIVNNVDLSSYYNALNKSPAVTQLQEIKTEVSKTSGIGTNLLASRVLGLQTIKATGTLTYDPKSHMFVNHTFSLAGILSGTYEIFSHIDGFLDTQVTQPTGNRSFPITQGQTLSTAVTNHVPGDVAPTGGDNVIDILDYNVVRTCIMDKTKCPNKNGRNLADFNMDGKVDQQDLDILMSHFGAQGASAIPLIFTCEQDPACKKVKGTTLQLCALQCHVKKQTN